MMKNEIETFITHSQKLSSEEIKNMFVDIFSHSYDLLSSCKKTITKIRWEMFYYSTAYV